MHQTLFNDDKRGTYWKKIKKNMIGVEEVTMCLVGDITD